MKIRPFFKTGDDTFAEKESFELDFKPSKDDVIIVDGQRSRVILVEYGIPANGVQAVSVFLIVAPAKVG
jgi:hypothetical protein